MVAPKKYIWIESRKKQAKKRLSHRKSMAVVCVFTDQVRRGFGYLVLFAGRPYYGMGSESEWEQYG
jgi:hypothetical protein